MYRGGESRLLLAAAQRRGSVSGQHRWSLVLHWGSLFRLQDWQSVVTFGDTRVRAFRHVSDHCQWVHLCIAAGGQRGSHQEVQSHQPRPGRLRNQRPAGGLLLRSGEPLALYYHPIYMRHLPNVGLMLGQRREWWTSINPLSPHDALKHQFTSLKTDSIFPQLRVLEWKFSWNWLSNTLQFSLIFQPHQVIFIHCKSRITAAIRVAACSGWRWQW